MLYHFASTKRHNSRSVQQRVVVAFRGTSSADDVMADMNLSFLKYSNPHRNSGGQPMDIAIHAGFYGEINQKRNSSLN